jgi:hypothetical protein
VSSSLGQAIFLELLDPEDKGTTNPLKGQELLAQLHSVTEDLNLQPGWYKNLRSCSDCWTLKMIAL